MNFFFFGVPKLHFFQILTPHYGAHTFSNMFEYMNMTCTFSVISSYIKCQNEFDPLIKIGFVRQIAIMFDYDKAVNKQTFNDALKTTKY